MKLSLKQFSELLQNVNDWDRFKSKLNSLGDTEKGDAFEYLTKYFLQISYKYKSILMEVWLGHEVPSRILKRLGIPPDDEGIDLVAETKSGELWSIQCKRFPKPPQRTSLS